MAWLSAAGGFTDAQGVCLGVCIFFFFLSLSSSLSFNKWERSFREIYTRNFVFLLCAADEKPFQNGLYSAGLILIMSRRDLVILNDISHLHFVRIFTCGDIFSEYALLPRERLNWIKYIL